MTDTLNEYENAIKETNRNLRILACAGSGKTTFVSKRIASLLKSGVEPENIIAFTYTEKAAAELNNRIVKELKDQKVIDSLNGFANMFIGTIHGWCLKALSDNELGYQKFSVLDEIKLKLFIDKNYNSIGMKDIFKIGSPNIKMKIFSDTSRFIQIMNIIRESDLDCKLPEYILSAKKNYENTLKENGYFDFSMIMTEAYEKLKDKGSMLYKVIEEKLKYLIVDEYQDVNPIQEKIINEIHNISKCNVTVVGDDDQNIYQWRGSNSKFLKEFDEKYSNNSPVLSLKLVKNYRSSKGITGLAKLFIENNENRIIKEMISAERQEFVRDEDILYNEFDEIEDENKDIIEKIEQLRGIAFNDHGETRGLDYSDFCILLRTWKKSESIAEVLERNNIPYITAGVNQLFDKKEVKAALSIFLYLNEAITSDDLLNSWLKILNIQIQEKNINEAIKELDKWFPDNFQKDRKSVGWGDYILQEVFWQFMNNAGIVEESFIKKDDETSVIQAEIVLYNLGKFSQVINDFEEINLNSSPPDFHLFNFLSFIKYAAQDYYPEGWLNNPYKTPNAVKLMTIHQAKGLEFPVVFIPGLNNNYLPLKKPGGLSVWHFLDKSLIKDQTRYEADTKEQRNEDERRLLYVAMTRSQKFLFISRAPSYDNRLYKYESPFISELVSDFIQKPISKITFANRIRTQPKPKAETINISLNFSVLKDFFQCNYRFKLVSMYGFSYPLNMRMGMGRSLHDSLMAIHKKITQGVILNEDSIEEITKMQSHFPYLGKSTELEKMKEMVRESAINYYIKNKEELKNIEFIEQDIKLNLDEGVFVSGRIDLIKKRLYEGEYETTIMEFKSNDQVQTKQITEHQLILYALGYKELVGKNADYIQVYDVENNKLEHKTKVDESLLKETQDKIQSAAETIRKQELKRINKKSVCSECFQNRLCSARIKLNIPGKK